MSLYNEGSTVAIYHGVSVSYENAILILYIGLSREKVMIKGNSCMHNLRSMWRNISKSLSGLFKIRNIGLGQKKNKNKKIYINRNFFLAIFKNQLSELIQESIFIF